MKGTGIAENKLVRLRKRKKLSQSQLAREVGVTTQAVSGWERGIAVPNTFSVLAALQRALGVRSLDTLMLAFEDAKRFREGRAA